MCIMPTGTVHILFYIDMGNHPRAQNFHVLQPWQKYWRIHSAYSPSIVLAMRK